MDILVVFGQLAHIFVQSTTEQGEEQYNGERLGGVALWVLCQENSKNFMQRQGFVCIVPSYR